MRQWSDVKKEFGGPLSSLVNSPCLQCAYRITHAGRDPRSWPSCVRKVGPTRQAMVRMDGNAVPAIEIQLYIILDLFVNLFVYPGTTCLFTSSKSFEGG